MCFKKLKNARQKRYNVGALSYKITVVIFFLNYYFMFFLTDVFQKRLPSPYQGGGGYHHHPRGFVPKKKVTYVGGDLYPTYFAVILCGPCLVHVDSVNGIGLTLGPPSIFIALQQHTPLCMHVHSGNGKLTLLSYFQ